MVNLLSNMTFIFAIFLLASLAGMVCERAGVINVGIDGFMVIGALIYAIFANLMGSTNHNDFTQFIPMILAVIITGITSLLHAFASIKLKANQIISGTAINILFQAIALFIATTTSTFSNGVHISSKYPPICLDNNNIFTLNFIIAIVIAIIIGVYFTYAKSGQRYISVGENPNATDAVGVSVIKYRYWAVVVSGMLAGLAGAFFVQAFSRDFIGTTNGWGFIALAIMIVGQWRVRYIVISSFLFSLFFAIGRSTLTDVISNNQELFRALPFILSLITMVTVTKWSKPPAAGGIPFDKSKR